LLAVDFPETHRRDACATTVAIVCERYNPGINNKGMNFIPLPFIPLPVVQDTGEHRRKIACPAEFLGGNWPH
jgi:hypothetical protein